MIMSSALTLTLDVQPARASGAVCTREVSLYDIVRIASIYGVKCPDPRYDRLCDLDLDGDIDIFDLVIAAHSYGASWLARTPLRTNSSGSLRDPLQRKIVQAAGRTWLFQTDDADFTYTSSADGVDWMGKTPIHSAPTIAGTNGYGEGISVAYDGTYIDYVVTELAQFDCRFVYRRGVPLSNGTISWLAAEQTVFDGIISHYVSGSPTIAIDNSHHPWVSYAVYNGSDCYLNITTSNTADGTWQTASGFPQRFVTVDDYMPTQRCIILTLQGERMAFLYCEALPGSFVYCSIWNGTAWEVDAEQASTDTVSHGDYMSGVALDNDIHFSYNNGTDLLRRCRQWGVGWQAEGVLVDDCGDFCAATWGLGTENNAIYAFWVNQPTTDHVYYKRWTQSDGWDISETDWFTAANPIYSGRTHGTSYKSAGGVLPFGVLTQLSDTLWMVEVNNIIISGTPITAG